MNDSTEAQQFELPVEIVSIEAVEPHPDPEVHSLAVAVVGGWRCVIGKDQFKTGDLALYVPIDAVLPPALVEKVFANSKIKPDGGRIRAIKIRKQVSYGLLVKPETVLVANQLLGLAVGQDYGQFLGITKYEPPQARQLGSQIGKVRSTKNRTNPNFRVYTKFRRIEYMPGLFKDGEDVVVTEKIHGTNFRAGWLPRGLKWYERAWKWLGGTVKPKYEFVVGTHYTQLTEDKEYRGFYKDVDTGEQRQKGNVYLEAVEKYDLRNKIGHDEVIYGEVYGSGIQPPGFTYGCAEGERRLVIFDVQLGGQYIDHDRVVTYGQTRGLDVVPTLYQGPFSKAALQAVLQGPSVLAPTEPIREGCVIRPVKEEQLPTGRKMQKAINPDFDLLKKRSDNH